MCFPSSAAKYFYLFDDVNSINFMRMKQFMLINKINEEQKKYKY